MESRKVAVLDLGTNTFNLLLAKITDQAYYVFYNEKIPVMIGKNGISRGCITSEAQQRAEIALSKFKAIIHQEGIDKIYGFATSAFRDASNGSDIKNALEKKTGLPIHIISGSTEARYIYEGVSSALDIGREPALIVDIGGGSVELIIANNTNIFWLNSFELGAQRLYDLFHINDPIATVDAHLLIEHLGEHLASLDGVIEKYRPTSLIGASGAFDTLSEICCRRDQIEVKAKDTEFPLDLDTYSRLHDELLCKDRSERMAIPGMIEMRVDMIVVASCLVRYIVNRHGFNKIRVSAHALKEGVLKSIQQDLNSEQQLAMI
jgi:exopolyphosphatase/guanosine-5'-triphosphate,3'-diphosphate pyrophosphatase